MSMPRNACSILVFASVLIIPSVVAAGGLDSFLEELDVRAKWTSGPTRRS